MRTLFVMSDDIDLSTLAGSARRWFRRGGRSPRFRQHAVDLIESLSNENAELRRELASAQSQITALCQVILDASPEDPLKDYGSQSNSVAHLRTKGYTR